MNLPERKRRILKAIVESYIETAEPVGSKMLAVSFDQPISSATIRNEMSELEEMGYLEKPHVSAGRVPSYAAYRLYVNELMDRYRLAAAEMDQMRRQMEDKMREMDNIMLSASRVVSEMTNQTTVSMSRQTEGGRVKKCEIITVDGGASYAVVLVTPTAVKNRIFHPDPPIEASTAAVLNTAINLALTEDRMEYLLPSMARSMEEDSSVFELTRKILEFIRQTETGGEVPEVYVDGVARLLGNREYQDTQRAREVLDYISDHTRLRDIFSPSAPNLVNIRIGPELDDPEMRDVSLVFSTYKIDDSTQGLIGILAPTRMDYAAAYAKLAGFIQAMGGSPPEIEPGIPGPNRGNNHTRDNNTMNNAGEQFE